VRRRERVERKFVEKSRFERRSALWETDELSLEWTSGMRRGMKGEKKRKGDSSQDLAHWQSLLMHWSLN